MRRGGLARTLSRIGIALGIAGAVHLGLWLVARWWHLGLAALPVAVDDTAAPPAATPLDQLTVVELAPGDLDAIPRVPIATLLGPADEVGRNQTHPAPNQPVDLPGEQAARRGGGATAGETAATQRADQTTDVPIRAELWNDKRDYQSPHERTARSASSPEAIRRERVKDVGDRAVATRVATAGATDASSGHSSEQRGAGTATAVDGQSRDAAAGTPTPAATDGAVRPNATPPLVETGATSVDTPVRGDRTADATNAAAASRETRPGPFEITPPASGGTARSGVAGPPAPGQLATTAGTGTAATRWGTPRGARDLAIEAAPQDPYFRTLFARLGKAVVFPRQLALELRAGRPVAELVLKADGSIAMTRIASSSGTPGFDRELLRAIATLSRLPPPPARLLAGKPEVRVRVEWAFDPGILR